MGTFWTNVRQSWSHEGLFGDTANVRNLTISYIAGCLVRTLLSCQALCRNIVLDVPRTICWDKPPVRYTYVVQLCLQFAIGWWLIIDIAATYPSETQFPHGYHALGAFTTLAIILLLWSRWDEEAFFCGPRVSRFIIFFGFFLGFTCVIASIWIMFQEYVVYKGRASSWPGVALFLQNSLIFSSGLVYKLGRTHDDYAAF
ncbi:hypothetical protein RvY_07946-1 [Ramazzottius varieornatus]|uniref:Uncharacterized protein n=1 Tax=Ramazzottius varieornatus TaxID=947166 RepID=A0A1D1VCA5_RAMVA|nr:hypothetical protein RvY_07946-1 [Ramazzottius varieornatus]